MYTTAQQLPNVNETTTSCAPAQLTVLYDGSCPLCRREVGVYQRLASSQPIEWRDVSHGASDLPAGGSRASYMARFHVLQANGCVLSGAKAFLALWETLPGWRWLAKLAKFPAAVTALEWLYCRFLVLRPGLQKLAVALEKRQAGR